MAVVALEDGAAFPAWTYVKPRGLIDVIHSDCLEEYEVDPRYVPASKRSG